MSDKTDPNVVVDDLWKALDGEEMNLARALLKTALAHVPGLDGDHQVKLGAAINRVEWNPDTPKAPWVMLPAKESLYPGDLNPVAPSDFIAACGDGDANPDEVRFPYPWGTVGRGNGHESVMAHNGAYVAHVHCWETTDYDKLDAFIKKVNHGHLP
jgi:hypothetical protein